MISLRTIGMSSCSGSVQLEHSLNDAYMSDLSAQGLPHTTRHAFLEMTNLLNVSGFRGLRSIIYGGYSEKMQELVVPVIESCDTGCLCPNEVSGKAI